jgi:hypothetical protein
VIVRDENLVAADLAYPTIAGDCDRHNLAQGQSYRIKTDAERKKANAASL